MPRADGTGFYYLFDGEQILRCVQNEKVRERSSCDTGAGSMIRLNGFGENLVLTGEVYLVSKKMESKFQQDRLGRRLINI